VKVGMILDAQFPPDIRVENEARTLAENGFDVFVLSFTHSKDLSSDEFWHGVRILRIPISKNLAKKGRALINTIFDVYTPYWAKKINGFIKQYNPDVLHVHDLFMLGAAFRATKIKSLPIIADLHENYVEGLKHYRFANSFPGNILISFDSWNKKEIEWCHRADHIITVIDEAVERYAARGIERNKLHVVANYVNIEYFLNTPDHPDIIDRIGSYFSATYIGGFDTHRGLENTINATAIVCKEIPDFRLVLIGHGGNSGKLTELASRLGIEDRVIFEGYQHPTKIPSYVKGSSICLIPHLKTVHTDNTIPHKLFHYMLLAKPVVASNCAPIERIVTTEQCGLIYQDDSAQDLADKIIKIYHDKNSLKVMGQNGRAAVLKKYNWQEALKELLKLYRDL